MIPQADARLGQLMQWRPTGRCVTAVKFKPRSAAAFVEHRLGRRLRGDEDGAGAVGALPVAIGDEEHFLVGLQQAIDGDEGVVLVVRDDVADRAGGIGDLARRRLLNRR